MCGLCQRSTSCSLHCGSLDIQRPFQICKNKEINIQMRVNSIFILNVRWQDVYLYSIFVTRGVRFLQNGSKWVFIKHLKQSFHNLPF